MSTTIDTCRQSAKPQVRAGLATRVAVLRRHVSISADQSGLATRVEDVPPVPLLDQTFTERGEVFACLDQEQEEAGGSGRLKVQATGDDG